MTRAPRTEFELIAWLAARLPPAPPGVLAGIGDDAAVLRPRRGRLQLLATDTILEGVHFPPLAGGTPALSPALIGRKALAVNLSDMAAMGGFGRVAVVALTLRRGLPFGVVRGLWDGLARLARQFDVALVGGDTTAWDGPLALTVTVLGEPFGRPVLRRGARPGDRLFVSGRLGGSRAGRHARFEPRIALARRLAAHAPPRAMIDISDGLVQDLGHLLAPDRLGATLTARAIPIARAAHAAARADGRSALDHALDDGEDFELLWALAPAVARRWARRRPPCPVTEIGVVETMPGVRLRHPNGRVRTRPAHGYDHLAR